MANQRYEITMSRALKQAPQRAFEVMVDIEAFPDFMPNVNGLTILEVDGNRKVTEWDTTLDDAPLVWVEESIYDYDQMIVHFRAVEGVFDHFDGCWRVRPAPGGSEVELELAYEIGLPEIEAIIGPILRQRMIANVERMLEAIEKQVGHGDE